VTYILARHAGEASHVARQQGLARGEWRHITGADQLRGTRGARVLATDCWADTRHGVEIHHLREVLRAAESQYIPVSCA
jgi:hypothetical protein